MSVEGPCTSINRAILRLRRVCVCVCVAERESKTEIIAKAMGTEKRG